MNSDRYGLALEFERALALLSCSRPRFWARVGYAIDPERLADLAVASVFRAAAAIAEETGRGPDSTVLVIQRLRRWAYEGKYTIEQIEDVVEMFGVAEDAGIPTEDALAQEVAPILQRAAHGSLLHKALDAYGKRGDVAAVAEEIVRSKQIGQTAEESSLSLGSQNAFREMARIQHVKTIRTGIPELDEALGGGVQRGTLNHYLGGTGAGKSIALTHTAAAGVRDGLFVAVSTLEIDTPRWLARLTANLTGMEIDAILKHGKIDAARKRLERAASGNASFGTCVVKYFTPGIATVDDLRQWYTELEQEHGKPPDLRITDYGDRLGAGKEATGYETGKIVWQGLIDDAKESNTVHWTASQPQRQKNTGTQSKEAKILDTDDGADSQHKARIADTVVTINLRNGGETILWFVAKHRHGGCGMQVGPIPHMFELGRASPLLPGESPW